MRACQEVVSWMGHVMAACKGEIRGSFMKACQGRLKGACQVVCQVVWQGERQNIGYKKGFR